MMLGDSWLPIILCVLVLAYKNLPFVWHIRFLRTLITRLFLHPTTNLPLHPTHLFLPAIHRTRSPATECDYNLHKSNSTYFTDLDISRGSLSLVLFSRCLSFRPSEANHTAAMILSGVQCVFRREIKPYQGYEVWTRVMAWDEKWLYLVSHFVERGKGGPRACVLQGGDKSVVVGDLGRKKDEGGQKKKVFASSVSRYVFKQGRKTVAPEAILLQCGLLPGRGEELWGVIEKRRKRDVGAAQLKRGWDAVHEAFEEVDVALGRYTDFLWR
ncbi:hypothetical protein BDW42DRAFT_196286 [Aspergillus taichungensis]|uniref:Thioesterase-like superfamily-domain-containing protein n=1 Tax=Aspergillus taichungensis TaxID=482145 RepID=A0A2J5HLB1_9EURO|nr:hypothetical protein BDW42DRAFT_196286 [Aspergillus taichungensis]